MSAERAVATLTWRLLLGKRRWMAIALCNALPVLAAWLFALDGAGLDPERAETFMGALTAAVVITVILPLAAVVFGTTAFGREIEDGTLTYLLAKPTDRGRLVVGKLAAAAAATIVTVLPGLVLAGWILLGTPFHPLVQGSAVGIPVAAVLYCGLFLALSLYTRKALILGLIYVLGWEGVLSRTFAGTRSLSVREYTTTLSDAVAARSLGETSISALPPSTALAMSAIVLAAAFLLAVRKLRGLELNGS